MPPYSRRDFAKFALLSVPVTGLLSSRGLFAADAKAKPAGKPNSVVNGVAIGLNVPYSFSNEATTADEVLAACVQLGVSALELRAQPIEGFLGIPENLLPPRRVAAQGNAAATAAVPVDANAKKNREEGLRKWRTSVSMDGVKAFRKKYEDAGVFTEILKVDGIFALSDDELDYYFTMAKAVGARAISCEISHNEAELKRVGAFADKHKMFVGYHGHATTTPEHWEHGFALAKYNGANVDLGHFLAGNKTSPVPFIKKYHERITHVHVKDKKVDGQNYPFGQGETPIVETLRLIRDNKWPIQATIEFEYRVPAGSTRMAEIAKAVQYCREALA